jgi:phage terminase large subunit
LIYTNWQPIPDEDFPKEDGVFWGIDYGYENDPTALVKCVRIGQSIYIHEVHYQSGGLPPRTICELLLTNGYNSEQFVYSEHDPDMIRQLRLLNVLAVPARKGPGTIKAGIAKVKEYKIFYTQSSTNIRTETQRYMWDKDPITGNSTNVPKAGFDHIMDAIRYAIYTQFYRQEV